METDRLACCAITAYGEWHEGSIDSGPGIWSCKGRDEALISATALTSPYEPHSFPRDRGQQEGKPFPALHCLSVKWDSTTHTPHWTSLGVRGLGIRGLTHWCGVTAMERRLAHSDGAMIKPWSGTALKRNSTLYQIQEEGGPKRREELPFKSQKGNPSNETRFLEFVMLLAHNTMLSIIEKGEFTLYHPRVV